ncbi:MAG: DUF1289 domain-containing protein [Ahrensia sp.]
MESPCTLVCSIDMETGWCHGCGRTRDEIGAWSLYTNQQRRDIMQILQARVDQIEKKPRRITKRRAMRTQR